MKEDESAIECQKAKNNGGTSLLAFSPATQKSWCVCKGYCKYQVKKKDKNGNEYMGCNFDER